MNPSPIHSQDPEPSNEVQTSPHWGPNIKLIVGLTFAAIFMALLWYFRSIIGPLVLAFILAYLLHPVIGSISHASKISWRAVVNIIYVVLLVLLGGSFTLTGLAVVQQIQNLILVVERFIKELPALVADLSSRVITIGPFELDFTQLDLMPIVERLLSTLQPLLTQVGGLVSTVATSAAATLGWTLFVLVISYFLLSEANQVPRDIAYADIPGYDQDLRRLTAELRKVWNAFLRGQLILITVVIISYIVLMTVLGVRYALGIAVLAGLSRFVPYVGPLTAWTVTGMVTFFQPANYFGLLPIQYTLLVLISAIILDQIFDNLISPRIFGQTLGIHPAAVLVAAIIMANLIGLLGLILAAPTVATVKLLGRYTFRKMLDLDPWPVVETPEKYPVTPLNVRFMRRIKAIGRYILKLIQSRVETGSSKRG